MYFHSLCGAPACRQAGICPPKNVGGLQTAPLATWVPHHRSPAVCFANQSAGFALQGETNGFPVSSSLTTQNGFAEPFPLIVLAKKHFLANLDILRTQSQWL